MEMEIGKSLVVLRFVVALTGSALTPVGIELCSDRVHDCKLLIAIRGIVFQNTVQYVAQLCMYPVRCHMMHTHSTYDSARFCQMCAVLQVYG